MRRKSARRHRSSRSPRRKSPSLYLWLALLVIIIVLVGKTVYKSLREANVLGKSIFLAEDFHAPAPAPPPADSGSGGGGGSAPAPQDQPQQQQPQQQSQPQPPQNMQNTGSAGSGQEGHGFSGQQNFQQRGQGEFRTQPGNNNPNFNSNNNFNGGQFGQSGFGSPQGNNQPSSQEQQQRFQQFQQQWQQEASKFGFQIQPGSFNHGGGENISFPSIQGNFNVGTSSQGGRQQQINLNDGNTRVSLGSLQAVRPDGSKFELNKDVAEKIHAAIKLETGSEVSQNGNIFNIKRGDVNAKTDLPIAFNVATKTFTVQTASGEKEIKVLPDEAVTKIKELHSNFTANADNVKLTELENEPVFEVPGTSQQRFLGVLPVGIQQTTVLSAKNGNLVTTNESVISRILDTFSF